MSGGVLDRELRRYLPLPGRFWHAATLDGGTESVEVVDQVTQGFP